jgi:kynureninase
VSHALEDWSRHAVSAWNTSEWIDLPYRIGAKIASHIGASSDEVVVSDSTSVNLFKVLQSAYLLNADRKVILTECDNFPADLYIAQGIKSIADDMIIRYVASDDILNSMDETTAVLMLTHVNYRSGRVYDMQAITKQAHALGIMVVWDLSHSVGAMPLDLDACEVDFAVGCTYKYLSGGPGAPSFIYINKKHHINARSPITGWMGHRSPFDFSGIFTPVNSAAKYMVGTPYILSLKALEGALEIIEDLDMTAFREKSLSFSKYLMEEMEKCVADLACASPNDPSLRGGHVAFTHEEAFAISRALIEKGVICDYRAPHLIRLCVNPLYLSLDDIRTCILTIHEIMHHKLYLNPKHQLKLKVT